jgi:cobalt-precorrin 5A hydrolase/precorrin-3B C17-methyltransferase
MALNPPRFVALTGTGAALARRLQADFPGSLVHGLARRVEDADATFDDARAELGALFASGEPIVAIMAAGIAVRALAPLLGDKHAEPPVVVLAEDGSAVVPLLGGHRGANDLARAIAARLGIRAALTTAGELVHGVALDSPPPGWRIATPDRLKPVAAALVAGERVDVDMGVGDAGWLSALHSPGGSAARIVVTDRADAQGDALVYHPPVLVVGVGCERGAPAQDVVAFVRAGLAEAGLAEDAVAAIVSIDIKMDEPAIHALAAALDVPARFFTAEELRQEEPRLATPSEYVKATVGVAGVAEAAALAAAGPEARLVLAKRVGPRATLAVARAPHDIDPRRVGRARGRLDIVGIGPGPVAWRTPEAARALRAADAVVGYGLYLDLLGPLIADKPQHARALGEEEARVALALALAARGQRVALVSSGDAGIYALATLAHELVARGDDPAWARLEIRGMPGVSAMQAAAARAGAPLGHDFCAISLSDLLTPIETIEARVRAAIAADFVIAFYNPASQRRREPFHRALAALREGRPPTTPVVVARNLGREGERVETVELQALDPDRVDMLTLLIVGSSATRIGPSGVFTPRGYAGKARTP